MTTHNVSSLPRQSRLDKIKTKVKENATTIKQGVIIASLGGAYIIGKRAGSPTFHVNLISKDDAGEWNKTKISESTE